MLIAFNGVTGEYLDRGDSIVGDPTEDQLRVHVASRYKIPVGEVVVLSHDEVLGPAHLLRWDGTKVVVDQQKVLAEEAEVVSAAATATRRAEVEAKVHDKTASTSEICEYLNG